MKKKRLHICYAAAFFMLKKKKALESFSLHFFLHCFRTFSSTEFVSRLCRYAGILNQEVQGGYSQFNFGFIGLATRTPIKQNPVTYAHKWFKELWHSRTRQERLVYAK